VTQDPGEAAPAAPAGRWRPTAPPASAGSPAAPPQAPPIAGFDAVALAGPADRQAPPPWRRLGVVRLPLPVAALAALLLAGAIVALAAGGLGGKRTVTVAAPAGSAPTSAGGRAVPPALPSQPLHVPFVVAGSRFAVFVDPRQPWTRAANRRRLPVGQRFVFVEVLSRHLGGAPTDLLALRYRLVTPDGIVTYPVSFVGTGKNALALPHAPQGKALAVSRLAFLVSAPLASLSFEFEPSTGGGPTIVVPLHS
jgi:hypothetical protein